MKLRAGPALKTGPGFFTERFCMVKRAFIWSMIAVVAVMSLLFCLSLMGCEANAASELRVVAFTAKWCGPCHADKPWLDAIRATGRAVVVEIDIDEDPEYAAEFGVTRIPRYFYFVNGVKYDAGNSAQTVYTTLTTTDCQK